MNKNEALSVMARVAVQRHKVYAEFDKAINRIMRPKERDQAMRMIEIQDKEQAILSVAIAMQENIKNILLSRGIEEEKVENIVRQYRQEARQALSENKQG